MERLYLSGNRIKGAYITRIWHDTKSAYITPFNFDFLWFSSRRTLCPGVVRSQKGGAPPGFGMSRFCDRAAQCPAQHPAQRPNSLRRYFFGNTHLTAIFTLHSLLPVAM